MCFFLNTVFRVLRSNPAEYDCLLRKYIFFFVGDEFLLGNVAHFSCL